MEIRKSISVFRTTSPTVSIGSSDIALVYLNHIEINIRKLKANPIKSTITSPVVEGVLAKGDSEPIESASPKIKSVSDSSLDFGIPLAL